MGAGTDLEIDLGQIVVNLDSELVDSELEINTKDDRFSALFDSNKYGTVEQNTFINSLTFLILVLTNS